MNREHHHTHSATSRPRWKQKILAALLSLILAACVSPYAKDFGRLERDYRSGQITSDQYYTFRRQLVEADAAWRAENADRMRHAFAAGAAGINAGQQNIQQQQQINAYNQRTMMMGMPRNDTINVNYSGNVNHSGHIRHY